MAIFGKRKQKVLDRAVKDQQEAIEQMGAALEEGRAAVDVVRNDIKARIAMVQHLDAEGAPSDVASLERYAAKVEEVGLNFPEPVLNSLRSQPAVIPTLGSGFLQEHQQELEEGVRFLEDLPEMWRGEGPEPMQADRALIAAAKDSLPAPAPSGVQSSPSGVAVEDEIHNWPTLGE